jgi:DnaK suppressor protein
MEAIRRRLEDEVTTTMSRLRAVTGPEEQEELPASVESIFDDADKIQADQAREMGVATKARLITRLRRLAAALERLENGEYGVCVECSETIKDARLRAMPEVERCVPCQEEVERLERLSHGNGSVWGQ